MPVLYRHTRRVKILRSILPTIAVMMTLAIAVWPLWQQMTLKPAGPSRFQAEEIALTTPAAGKPPQLQVINPEYTGRDSEGRPYRITAKLVKQGLSKDSAMTMENPLAQLTLDKDTGQHLALGAQTGLYNPQAQTLALEGAVTLSHSDGYKLYAQDMAVDLPSGAGKTDNPVHGNGPMGQLAADAMEMRDKGTVLILHGHSKVTLQPQPKTPE